MRTICPVPQVVDFPYGLMNATDVRYLESNWCTCMLCYNQPVFSFIKIPFIFSKIILKTHYILSPTFMVLGCDMILSSAAVWQSYWITVASFLTAPWSYCFSLLFIFQLWITKFFRKKKAKKKKQVTLLSFYWWENWNLTVTYSRAIAKLGLDCLLVYCGVFGSCCPL